MHTGSLASRVNALIGDQAFLFGDGFDGDLHTFVVAHRVADGKTYPLEWSGLLGVGPSFSG